MADRPGGAGAPSRGPGGRRLSVEDLTGEAAEVYESWRTIGLSEAAALQAVADAGLAEVDEFDRRVEFFMNFAGLSEAEAKIAVQGREHLTEVGARSAMARGSGSSDTPSRGRAGDGALVERIVAAVAGGQTPAGALAVVALEEGQAGRPVPSWLSEAVNEASRRVFGGSGAGDVSAVLASSGAPVDLVEKLTRPPARKPKPKKTATTRSESDRKPGPRKVDLVESDAFKESVRFYQDVMGLDENAAKVAARGRR